MIMFRNRVINHGIVAPLTQIKCSAFVGMWLGCWRKAGPVINWQLGGWSRLCLGGAINLLVESCGCWNFFCQLTAFSGMLSLSLFPRVASYHTHTHTQRERERERETKILGHRLITEHVGGVVHSLHKTSRLCQTSEVWQRLCQPFKHGPGIHVQVL